MIRCHTFLVENFHFFNIIQNFICNYSWAQQIATLFFVAGEEYHVVRFVSLRSQQPLAMDEADSQPNLIITDRHADIEKVIYFGLGGACLFLIIPLIIALCRLYLTPIDFKWPWKREKIFGTTWPAQRHQRMEEPQVAVGGPLTVIYSGSFVERYVNRKIGAILPTARMHTCDHIDLAIFQHSNES